MFVCKLFAYAWSPGGYTGVRVVCILAMVQVCVSSVYRQHWASGRSYQIVEDCGGFWGRMERGQSLGRGCCQRRVWPCPQVSLPYVGLMREPPVVRQFSDGAGCSVGAQGDGSTGMDASPTEKHDAPCCALGFFEDAELEVRAGWGGVCIFTFMQEEELQAVFLGGVEQDCMGMGQDKNKISFLLAAKQNS
jgi:hypothetical protein